jgi:adenine-specific DNA glycosylase
VHEAARRLVTCLTRDDPEAIEPPEGLRASDWNQALMELGATVCTPSSPNCTACPWSRTCIGYRAGMADDIPVRKAKGAVRQVTLRSALVRRGEHFLLVRRPEGSLLSGLWELPTTEEAGTIADLEERVRGFLGTPVVFAEEPSRSFRHAITNRRITVHVHEVRLEDGGVAEEPPAGIAWVRRVDLRDFGASSMTRKAFADC